MSHIPSELKYLSSHEWLRVESDGTAYMGITDHAQAALGDLVFVETPEMGAALVAGEEAGVVESVKAASDLYSPVSGEVVEINEALADAPETINNDPYGDGWVCRIKLTEPSEIETLMSAEDYTAQLESEEA